MIAEILDLDRFVSEPSLDFVCNYFEECLVENLVAGLQTLEAEIASKRFMKGKEIRLPN